MFEIIAYGVYVALFVVGYALIGYFTLAIIVSIIFEILLTRVGFENLSKKPWKYLVEQLPIRFRVNKYQTHFGKVREDVELEPWAGTLMAVSAMWAAVAAITWLNPKGTPDDERLVSAVIDMVHATASFLAEWTSLPIVYIASFAAVWYGLGQLKGPIHTIINVIDKLKKES